MRTLTKEIPCKERNVFAELNFGTYTDADVILQSSPIYYVMIKQYNNIRLEPATKQCA